MADDSSEVFSHSRTEFLQSRNYGNTQSSAQEPERPGPVASGGWGFDGGDGSQPKITVPTQKKHYKDDDDEVIPLIPDLEDEGDEDITRQVAAPPAAAQFQQKKVPNLRELDADIRTVGVGPVSAPEEGVDLAILLQALCPQKALIEEDIVWDHDLLFHEVASYVTKEREMAEDGDVPASDPQRPNDPPLAGAAIASVGGPCAAGP